MNSHLDRSSVREVGGTHVEALSAVAVGMELDDGWGRRRDLAQVPYLVRVVVGALPCLNLIAVRGDTVREVKAKSCTASRQKGGRYQEGMNTNLGSQGQYGRRQ